MDELVAEIERNMPAGWKFSLVVYAEGDHGILTVLSNDKAPGDALHAAAVQEGYKPRIIKP
jgi:hypothetical protein